jgi:ferrochelatase
VTAAAARAAPAPPAAADLGVALLNLGGPWSLDLVEPFLRELFADREILRLSPFPFLQKPLANLIVRKRLAESRRIYAAIGGRSPLLATTVVQARALERELARRGVRARVLPAMRYARPRAADAVRSLLRAGCTRAVAVTLYPQYSRATTGSSLGDLERAADAAGGLRWLPPVREYPDHPVYADALAATVLGALQRVSTPRRPSATILFSAHGLPERFIREGDPYAEHVDRTVRAVVGRLGVPNPWCLAFQSRTGPVRWIRPYTDEVLPALAKAGVRAVVAVPVSFVSDHVETPYEIETLFGGLARRCGIEEFVRAPALNGAPAFAAALADMIEERLRP